MTDYLKAQAERQRQARQAEHRERMHGYGLARCANYIADLPQRHDRVIALAAAGELWPGQLETIEQEVKWVFELRSASNVQRGHRNET